MSNLRLMFYLNCAMKIKNFIPRYTFRLAKCLVWIGLINILIFTTTVFVHIAQPFGHKHVIIDQLSRKDIFESPSITLTKQNGVTRPSYFKTLTVFGDKTAGVQYSLINTALTVKEELRGAINVYHWTRGDFCLYDTHNIYWSPLFPDYPSESKFYHSLSDKNYINDVAFRRFLFYLKPPVSGFYTFQAGFRDGFDMFLLEGNPSLAYKPLLTFRSRQVDMEKLKRSTSDKSLFTITSQSTYLDKKRFYYVDIVHSMYVYGKLNVTWKLPETKIFIPINRQYFYKYSKAANVDLPMPLSFGMEITDNSRRVQSDPRLDFFKYPYAHIRQVVDREQECSYRPSYLLNSRVGLYHGAWYVVEDKTYPDYTLYEKNVLSLLSKEKAEEVVNGLILKIKKHPSARNYKLHRIVSVQENSETKYGKRYFVEMDILNPDSGNILRLSDYVYKLKNETKVCLPKEYQWQPETTIYLVTVIKDQNKWLKALIDAVSKTVQETKDSRLHWLLLDFNSKGIDLSKEMEASRTKHTIISMAGKFNKVRALNRAAKEIPDDNSIIFILDLHLIFPKFLFDQVRKHTIKGKALYCPMLIRLQCGEHPEYTNMKDSKWMAQGYGMIAAYKGDWNIIGGMNESMFGEKWGGEDWEFVDRVLSKGYEVIQHRLPGYYHIYHSTKGTWDGTKLY